MVRVLEAVVLVGAERLVVCQVVPTVNQTVLEADLGRDPDVPRISVGVIAFLAVELAAASVVGVVLSRTVYFPVGLSIFFVAAHIVAVAAVCVFVIIALVVVVQASRTIDAAALEPVVVSALVGIGLNIIAIPMRVRLRSTDKSQRQRGDHSCDVNFSHHNLSFLQQSPE